MVNKMAAKKRHDVSMPKCKLMSLRIKNATVFGGWKLQKNWIFDK